MIEKVWELHSVHSTYTHLNAQALLYMMCKPIWYSIYVWWYARELHSIIFPMNKRRIQTIWRVAWYMYETAAGFFSQMLFILGPLYNCIMLNIYRKNNNKIATKWRKKHQSGTQILMVDHLFLQSFRSSFLSLALKCFISLFCSTENLKIYGKIISHELWNFTEIIIK